MATRQVTTRANRYPGPCSICQQTVLAGEGLWSRPLGVHHRPARWHGSPVSGSFVGGCPKRGA